MAMAGLMLSGCGTTALAPVSTSLPAQTSAQSVTADSGYTEGLHYASLELLGMTPKEARNLANEGAHSAGDLLRLAAKPSERQRLAAKTGMPPSRLLTFVNYADLMRITGVGPRYSFLLEDAGVDTVAELAQRNPDSLFATVKRVNNSVIVFRRPSAEQIKTWVSRARTLPRAVEY
jgi:predicted flap endonuclease-1-like 5' DNA nuclease